MRTRVLALAGVACLAAGAGSAWAQEQATLLLRSGERVSGSLVDMGGRDFTMTVGGGERRILIGEVVLIDFGGTARDLPATETSRVSEGQQMLVLRNGQTVLGALEDIGGTRPLRITFNSGGPRDYQSTSVLRIYLSPTPREAGAGESLGPTDADPSWGRTIEVSAKRDWTPTGIAVKKGQVISLQTRGRVRLSENPDDVAESAGLAGKVAPAGAPLPGQLAGALVGRIGSGPPFGIGNQASIPAPAAGELILGINDDHFADNDGAFRVTIKTSSRR